MNFAFEASDPVSLSPVEHNLTRVWEKCGGVGGSPGTNMATLVKAEREGKGGAASLFAVESGCGNPWKSSPFPVSTQPGARCRSSLSPSM